MKKLNLLIDNEQFIITNYFMYENETELKVRIDKRQNLLLPLFDGLNIPEIVSNFEAMGDKAPRLAKDNIDLKKSRNLLVVFNELPEFGLNEIAIQIITNGYYKEHLTDNGFYFETSIQCVNQNTNEEFNIAYKVVLLDKEKKIYNIEISQSL